MLALFAAGAIFAPSFAGSQDMSLTLTSDFDAGTKNLAGDGNFGTETGTDNPGIAPDQLELASAKGDAFSVPDADADTFKWDLESFCTIRGPTTIVREISNGLLRLGAGRSGDHARVGVVQSTSLSGDVDVRVKVDEVVTDPRGIFEFNLLNEHRCYEGASPTTADGVFYEWDEGSAADSKFTLKAIKDLDGAETTCGATTTLTMDPVYLRITRVGELWTFYYGSDGVTWIQDEQCVHPVTGPLFTAFMTKDRSGGVTTTFEVDDYHAMAGTLGPGGYRTSGDWTSPPLLVPDGHALDRIEIGGAFDETSALDRSEIRRGTDVLAAFEADNTFLLDPANPICGSDLNVRLYLKGAGLATPVVRDVTAFFEPFQATSETVSLGTSTGTANQCASDDARDLKSESLGPGTSTRLVTSESIVKGSRAPDGDGPPSPSDVDTSDDVFLDYNEEQVGAFSNIPPDSQLRAPGELDGGTFPVCLEGDDEDTCTWSESATTSETSHGPSSESVLMGSEVGTFPAGVQSSDNQYVEYTEGAAGSVSKNFFPSSQTIVTGTETSASTYKQGTFTRKTNGPGLQSVTGVGFQGQALILWWTRQGALGTSVHLSAGIGLVSSPTQQYAIAWAADDGVSPSNAGRRSAVAGIAILADGTPTLDGQASFVGFTADGWTLDWTTNPSPAQATIIHYIVLGSSVAQVYLGQFTGPPAGVTGSRSYTGVGFRGDLALFMGTLQTAPGDSVHATMGFGAATGPANRGTASNAIPDGTTTADTEDIMDTKALTVYNPASAEPATDQVIDFVSFDPDGFTLNHAKVTTGDVIFWGMVIQGGPFKVNSLIRPTSTGDQSVAGVGFRPIGVLFWGTATTAAFGSENNGAEFVFGAGTQELGSVVKGAVWGGMNDGVNPADANMHSSTTKSMVDLSLASRSVQAAADYKSSNSDGFTVTWTTVSGSTSQKWLWLAIGSGSGSDSGSTGCPGPTEIDTGMTLGEDLNDHMRTVFRNPRGHQNRYVIYQNPSTFDIVYKWSADGCSWSPRVIISSTPSSPPSYNAFIFDSGSDLKVFLVIVENGVVTYRRGTIADSADTVAFDPPVTVATPRVVLTGVLHATIVRTQSGRLIVGYADDVTRGSGSFRTTRLIGSSSDGPAPSWSGDTLWDDPSSFTDNRNKAHVVPVMANFRSTFPTRILLLGLVPDPGDTVSYMFVTDTPEWDGVAFSHLAKTIVRAGVDPADSLGCVIDEAERAHCLIEDQADLFSVRGQTPGEDDWGPLALVAGSAEESGKSSLAIDRSSTPNVLYAFFDKSLTDRDLFYKTTSVDAISWSPATTIPYPPDVRHVVSTVRDSVGGIHVAGERATDVIFYFEIVLPRTTVSVSSFPSCVQASDSSVCVYREAEQGEDGPFQVDVEIGWTGVDTTGDQARLWIEGRLGATNPETIDIQIYGGNEVTLSSVVCSLSSTVEQTYDCGLLTADQLDGGAPDIRFVDRERIVDGSTSTFDLDMVWIESLTSAKRLDVRYDWLAIPAGAGHDLRIEGRIQDEPVDVFVLTPPASWSKRLTITSTIDAVHTYTLTAAEYNNGAPSVRFVDVDASDTAASRLFLDHARIVEIDTTYALNLQVDWTNSVTPSGPTTLEVRASRSGDAEELIAEVWDWQDLVWRSAFTIGAATETPHSTVLQTFCSPASGDCEVSRPFPGSVRMRFRDLSGPDPGETSLIVDLAVVQTADLASVLEVQYDWSTIGGRSGSDELRIEARRSDEDVLVQVWDWDTSTWTTRLTIATVTDLNVSYVLTDPEISPTFQVRVRFIGSDETSADDDVSDLFLDYVAIEKREYRLDIENRIMGISASGPFTLRLEARLSAAGENFDVYVWDFVLGDWTLWTDSAFTTTDQTFERVLAPSEISSGEVLVRFVDDVGDASTFDPTANGLEVDLLEVESLS